MKKVYIQSSGCITNLADDNILRSFFLKNGWELVRNPEKTDLIVFNTCGYNTETFARIKELQKLKKAESEIVVGGCMPAMRKRSLQEVFSGIIFTPRNLGVLNRFADRGVLIEKIPGNIIMTGRPKAVSMKGKVVDWIGTRLINRRNDCCGNAMHDMFRHMTLVRLHDEKIFYIKIGVGCTSKCAYCSRIRAKGRIKSKDRVNIVKEFEHGLALGYKEFLLSGDDSGSWGWDKGEDLIGLLRILAGYPRKYKIHIRYIEPSFFIRNIDAFIELFDAGKFFFIGLPIQSGSSPLLRLMNRRYTAEDYIECVRRVNACSPAIFFQTHFLVGYPLETEMDFHASLDVLKSIRVDDVQIYEYHPEPGTVGGKIRPQLSPAVKKDRAKRLRKEFVKRKIMSNGRYAMNEFVEILKKAKRQK